MILYFTGTGNSRYIAKRIAQAVGDTPVSLNERLRRGDTSKLCVEGDLVVVTPTYAWRIPRVVERLLLETELTKVKRVWFVMNCGSEIGNASQYNRLLSEKKGFSYMGTAEIVMPENYIAMFQAPGSDKAKEIVNAAEPSINRTAQQIAAGQAFSEPKSRLLDRFLSGPVNRAFYPLFVKAKGFHAGAGCSGCGACEKLCPLNNISMNNGKPAWGKDCTQCMACICGCPEEAIEYGRRSRGKVRYWFGK